MRPFHREEQAWESFALTSRPGKTLDDKFCRFLHPSPSTPNGVETGGCTVLFRTLTTSEMSDFPGDGVGAFAPERQVRSKSSNCTSSGLVLTFLTSPLFSGFPFCCVCLVTVSLVLSHSGIRLGRSQGDLPSLQVQPPVSPTPISTLVFPSPIRSRLFSGPL